MTSQPVASRGVYVDEVSLPYRVFDADHHIYPAAEARIRHLPRRYHEALEQTAGLGVPDPEGDLEGMDEETIATTIGTHPVPEGGYAGVDLNELPQMERMSDRTIPIPGAMLNRLNPMKDIDLLSRAELVERYNAMRPAFENKAPRLKLMDVQGVEAAVVHTGGFENEPAFRRGDLELGYAVAHAWNEYVLEDWGFNTENRILSPLQVPLVDPDRAVAELEWGMANGAVLVNLPSGDAYGRSPFDPIFDPVWARINEAKLRVVTHLGGGNRVDLSSAWSEDGTVPYPKYDAFQWVLYWSDRPVMETVTAMMFHNLFGRFPNVNVLFAEFGAVWLPYLIRKLDHAVMLGRRPTWGKLPARPSQLFKQHCLVAPYPEENVTRAAEVVGWDCLVFGSDFPHSEGIPDPMQYVKTIEGVGDDKIRKIMRDNLRNFLALTDAGAGPVRIGVHFPTKEVVPLEQLLDRFREVEQRGLSSVWMPQSRGFDALTVLAIAGTQIPRIEFATGVIPTFPRHPITLAAHALTTNAAAGGRLVLGIGLSHQRRIVGSYALSYDRPLRHMREYLDVLLPLLRDGVVDVTGDTIGAHIDLVTPGAVAPPVLLAALQPRMLALVGGVADGTLTWCTGPVTIEQHTVPLITQAARDAGRPAPRVCVALPAMVTDDEDHGRRMADLELAEYPGLPVYRAVLDRKGVDTPGEIAVVGNAASVTAQLRHLEDVGMTDFVVALCGEPADRARTLDHLATLV